MKTLSNSNIMKPKRIFRFIVYLMKFIFIMIFLSSCISLNKTKLLQEKSIKDVSQEFVNQKTAEYKIQPGDQLYVQVYSVDPQTSRLFNTDMPMHYTNISKELNSYKVDEEGYINFSFIDRVQVAGMPVEEARDLLQETINEYFKEATVVVKLVYYRVSVLGEVNNPGSFMVDNKQINVLQAISEAGGINTFGDRQEVVLVRQTNNGSKIYYMDLTDNAILEKDQFYLMPNDVLYVKPMRSKNLAFEKIPYSLLLSTATLGLTIYGLLMK